MAEAIPDARLRELALRSLQRKGCNVEGAAAFELLAHRRFSPGLIRALTAGQTLCDYVDLLAEQPVLDPVANGYRLHEALIVAVSPGESHRDYYRHSEWREDGGYLLELVEDVREGLEGLAHRDLVAMPLRHMAKRIASYQSFNHGDGDGSFEPFTRWAYEHVDPDAGLSWWETGAGFGSTLMLFALIASAATPGLTAADVAAIERAYFPWIGVLHTLLDSLVDFDEDMGVHGRCLFDCYRSADHAAERLAAIAREALRRAAALPSGRRHVLILIAMTGFYLREVGDSRSPHARAVAAALRRTVGGMVVPARMMISLRHAAKRRPVERLEAERPAVAFCG
jgi:tetraprenyl-beta-curcumene synthase